MEHVLSIAIPSDQVDNRELEAIDGQADACSVLSSVAEMLELPAKLTDSVGGWVD